MTFLTLDQMELKMKFIIQKMEIAQKKTLLELGFMTKLITQLPQLTQMIIMKWFTK